MAVATIEAGGFKAVLSESNIRDLTWSVNKHDEQIIKIFEHIIKNTKNSDLIEAAIRRKLVTESTIEFLMQTKAEDLCLWKEIMYEDIVRKMISQRFLIELMSKSDSISSIVAEDLASFKNCDAIALCKWMCEHSSESTLCILAEFHRSPKDILDLLSVHDNEYIASIAKATLKKVKHKR